MTLMLEFSLTSKECHTEMALVDLWLRQAQSRLLQILALSLVDGQSNRWT